MQALIVEDDDAVVEHIRFCLKRHGYTVTAARNGVAALDLCQSQYFDWIVCDIMLPRLNGISFLRSVKRLLAGTSTRILVISSMDDYNIKSEVLAVGAEAFLLKPVTAQMLADALNKPQPAVK